MLHLSQCPQNQLRDCPISSQILYTPPLSPLSHNYPKHTHWQASEGDKVIYRIDKATLDVSVLAGVIGLSDYRDGSANQTTGQPALFQHPRGLSMSPSGNSLLVSVSLKSCSIFVPGFQHHATQSTY
jgi:hypothetical protein